MKLLLVLYSSLSFASYLVSSNISKKRIWSEVTKSDEVNIKILINYLQRSHSGKKLIRAAKNKAAASNKKLLDIIKIGETSLTDTTLYRKFSKTSPEKIEYETESIVKLNKSLNQFDALLDLAHELTHYVYRDQFNPYRLDFTLEKFIRSTIEEKGGEAHAFLTECKVLEELFPKDIHARSNCKKMRDESLGLSHDRAVSHFYSVGNYYKNFKISMQEYEISDKFDKISNKSIQFISSAYGVPYPVAAFHEYTSVMKKVCENDLDRYASIEENSRSIASVNSFKESILIRCKQYL